MPNGESPFDFLRRKYLEKLAAKTGRSTILYSTKWTSGGGVDSDLISITPDDIQGLMEVVHDIPGGRLDLILHSPGGSPEAAEALVKYLRTKFDDIRVIVPHAAMSAATMLSCAANRIVLGKHSFLGPIDPQLLMVIDGQRVAAPAYAIIEQFELAKKEIADKPATLPAWLPMLRQYGPALIIRCRLAQQLSEKLVGDWLENYHFAGDAEAKGKAGKLAASLASHGGFLTHGRFIDRVQARSLGFANIDDLEADQEFQDLVLSVFHATMHTHNATPAVKIIENHKRRAWLKQQITIQVQQQPGQPGKPGAFVLATPPGGPQ